MAIRALIFVLVLGFSGAYAWQLAANRVQSEGLPTLAALPAQVNGWSSEDFALSDEVAAVLDADVTLQRRFTRPDGREVWLFLAYFAQQQVNSQIHSPRHCLPGGGWRVASIQKQALQLSQGEVPATRMLIERSGVASEVIYWFRTRGGPITGEYALKWDLVCNSLARRPTDAVLVRYTASQENAAAMRELMLKLDPPLNALLAAAGLQ